MANKCNNTLIITGNKQELAHIDNLIITNLDSDNWLSGEEALLKVVSYDFSIEKIELVFVTNWKPPFKTLNKLSKLFSNVLFELTYMEPLSFLGANINFKNSIVLSNTPLQTRDLYDETLWYDTNIIENPFLSLVDFSNQSNIFISSSTKKPVQTSVNALTNNAHNNSFNDTSQNNECSNTTPLDELPDFLSYFE